MSFVLENKEGSDNLPAFSITIPQSELTAIYSHASVQGALIHYFSHEKKLEIFEAEMGLYERLTVEENVRFYHKWFGSELPFPELMVMCRLHVCSKKRLKQLTPSELRRVAYAKYFLMDVAHYIWMEPIHGVDVETVNVFMELTDYLIKANQTVLVVVSNLEQAIMLTDKVYKLNENSVQEVQTEQEEQAVEVAAPDRHTPRIADLFKIHAKLDDKVILFDPTEIDYIESQEGKSSIVINDESYLMDSSLADIEKKLELYGFYRCHRSYIVNLQKVREIITWSKNTYSLKLQNKNESTIPLSRAKVQEIQEIFNLK